MRKPVLSSCKMGGGRAVAVPQKPAMRALLLSLALLGLAADAQVLISSPPIPPPPLMSQYSPLCSRR